MPTAKHRKERRERQAAEVEQSQAALRASIDETQRLVAESDEMLRRHRQEQQDADAAHTEVRSASDFAAIADYPRLSDAGVSPAAEGRDAALSGKQGRKHRRQGAEKERYPR